MVELNGHNTRKSQFLVIACVMPIFVFLAFHTGKEELLNKEKIKITSIGKADPDSLSQSEAKVFYSTLFATIVELHQLGKGGKNNGNNRKSKGVQ